MGTVLPQEMVSIVIPIYNAQRTLEACLDSVLKQDYQNIEIILVNDGSKDDSEKLCMSYRNQYADKVRYICQPNSGPAAARNRGVEESTGKYIAFVDADDTVSSNMISTMAAAAEEHCADMVVCAYWMVENGKRTECHYHLPEGLYQGAQAEKVLFSLMDEVDGSVPPYSWVRLTKKAVFTEHNLRFHSGLVRSEDFHFWTKVHAKLKSVYLLSTTPLYDYVCNDQSITHRYVKDYWKGVQFIYADLRKALPNTAQNREKLDIMLVKRALISLNNASMCTSMRQAWKDIWEILDDEQLNAVIKSLEQTDVKRFRSFRRMMCHHRKLFVACKYMLENIQNAMLRRKKK